MMLADSVWGGGGLPHLSTAVGLAVLLIGIWQSGRIANLVRAAVLRSTEIDHELAPFARQMTRVVAIILSIGIGLALMDVGTGGLLAFLSASGLGLTLALQSMILNMASGVALLMFRPFKTNDEIEASGVQGRVKAIKLMSTELRTADNVHVSLPNSKVWGAEIRNFTTEPFRRIDTLITVPNAVEADDAMTLLMTIARRVAAEGEAASQEGPVVSVQELKEATTVLRVRLWCASKLVDERRTALLTEARRALPSLAGWRTGQPPAPADQG
jgi:small conductance mechanosensitive channel